MKTVQLLKSEEFKIGTTDKNGHKLRKSNFFVTQNNFEVLVLGPVPCESSQILKESIRISKKEMRYSETSNQ